MVTMDTGTTMGSTARTEASPLALIRQAAGGPREIADKLGRLYRALAAYADAPALDARLERLKALGYVDVVPSRLQLVVGSVDMLRFWITPAAAEYYESRNIDFTFHQVLRILDEPASMVDPTGFLSTRDNIIGHLMQVVHANPCYDLQLLASHEQGLEELERQVRQMIAGTHPRAASIGAIVEEPDYHPRLLEYTRRFRADPGSESPLRDNIEQSEHWRRIERVFGELPTAMRYFARLPDTPLGALRHLLFTRTFPHHLTD